MKRKRTKMKAKYAKKSYYATVCEGEGLVWRVWANVKKFQHKYPYRVTVKGFQSMLDAEAWLNTEHGIDEPTFNVFEKSPSEQRTMGE